MKALIFLPVWKRYNEALITYKGVHRIQKVLKEENIDSQVLIISSEAAHTDEAKKQGFTVVECNNFPVGQKHNCGLEFAMSLEWDYLFQMGSNNLLSNIYIRIWAAASRENYKMFGSRKFYNLLPDKNHITIFKTKNKYRLSGVGRGIRRDVIEARLKEGPVWPPDKNKTLDKESRLNLKVAESEVISIISDDLPGIIDIRTESEDLNVMDRNPKKLNKDYLVKHFPELKDLFT